MHSLQQRLLALTISMALSLPAPVSATPAEYLLEGAIHEIEYDSGDLFGNKYEIKFSAGATRKRLCSIRERVGSGLKGDSDPLSQIYKTVIDRMSTIITEKTLAKIPPAPGK